MKTPVRTLVVDDEPLARDRLLALLEKQPSVELIGSAGDGRTAVERILAEKPDLVFLDIQMPELDGFGVLEALRGQHMPLVVFVTAYDQYALRAFEVQAVDYLLKPYDRERLQAALQRATDRLAQGRPADLESRIAALLESVRPSNKSSDRIAVRNEGKVILVKIEDLDWVEAADNYVVLHAGAESHVLRETMAAMEQRLPPDRFARISRSCIVNMDRIKELQPMFHGEYTVILRGGARLNLSRSYRDRLQHLLGRE